MAFTDSDSAFCPVCGKMVTSCSCFFKKCKHIYAFPKGLNTIIEVETEAQPGTDLDVVAPTCPKNTQHDHFIEVNDFSLNHLPPDMNHPTVYVWLRNCSPLVVRLLGRNKATGRACLIPQEIGIKRTCHSPHCHRNEHLGRGHEVYGGIGIITNKHVVRGSADAADTSVEFFFNDEFRDTLVVEHGCDVHMTNRKMDFTLFTCYVHDENLLTLVATFDKRRNYSWQSIPQHIRLRSKQYAIVISHPHGTSKKISIGRVIGREIRDKSGTEYENLVMLRNIFNICEENGALLRFAGYIRQLPDLNLSFTATWYSTATCRGSSGAPVFMGNVVIEGTEEINQAHTHRGVDESRGYNICYT